MKAKPVVPREQANRDIDQAIAYYLGEDAGPAALGFIDALQQAYGHIGRHPATGSPRYAHELNLPGLRCWPLTRYPYLRYVTDGPLTNRGGFLTPRLIDLAKHLRDARKHGEELGLSSEETAFYDALAGNGSAREVMKNDTLRLMARELTEMVKKMPRLDWTQRESVRADLRRSVRHLLAKYGYPPDLAEGATLLVLRKAELSTQYS